MASGFYKAALRGSCEGQELINVLYYSPLVPDAPSFDEATATSLAQDIGDAWYGSMYPLLPPTFTFNDVLVSMVDQNGVTVSPYTVSYQLGSDGQFNGITNTVAQVAVVHFNCGVVSQEPDHAPPRRSYLAVGPLCQEHLNADGSIVSLSGWQTAAAAAFGQGHLVGATQYLPYRIGRTVAPSASDPDGSIAGVGRVVSVTVRPFSTFRRSRLQRPTGA